MKVSFFLALFLAFLAAAPSSKPPKTKNPNPGNVNDAICADPKLTMHTTWGKWLNGMHQATMKKMALQGKLNKYHGLLIKTPMKDLKVFPKISSAITTVNGWMNNFHYRWIKGTNRVFRNGRDITVMPLHPTDDYFQFTQKGLMSVVTSNCMFKTKSGKKVPRTIVIDFDLPSLSIGVLKYGLRGVGWSPQGDMTHFSPRYWDGASDYPGTRTVKAQLWFQGDIQKSQWDPSTALGSFSNGWLGINGAKIDMFLKMDTLDEENPQLAEFPVKVNWGYGEMAFDIELDVIQTFWKVGGTLANMVLSRLPLSPASKTHIVLDRHPDKSVDISVTAIWNPTSQSTMRGNFFSKFLMFIWRSSHARTGETEINLRFSTKEKFLAFRYITLFSWVAVSAQLHVNWKATAKSNGFAGVQAKLLFLFPTVNNVAEFAFLALQSTTRKWFGILKGLTRGGNVGKDKKKFQTNYLAEKKRWETGQCHKDCKQAAVSRCVKKRRRGFWGWLRSGLCKIWQPIKRVACKAKCTVLYWKWSISEVLSNVLIKLESKVGQFLHNAKVWLGKKLVNVPIPLRIELGTRFGTITSVKKKTLNADVWAEVKYLPVLRKETMDKMKTPAPTTPPPKGSCLAAGATCVPYCEYTEDPTNTTGCVQKGSPWPKGVGQCCHLHACTWHRGFKCQLAYPMFPKGEVPKRKTKTWKAKFSLSWKLKDFTRKFINEAQRHKGDTAADMADKTIEKADEEAVEGEEVVDDVNEERKLPQDPKELEKMYEKEIGKKTKRSVVIKDETYYEGLAHQYNLYLNRLIKFVDKKADEAHERQMKRRNRCNRLLYNCPRSA